MTNKRDDTQGMIEALDRLGAHDRAAMSEGLPRRLEAARRASRRSVLVRLAPAALAALAAAVIGIALVPFLVGGAGRDARAVEVVSLDDAMDESWLLGDGMASLDAQLAELSRSLDETEQSSFTLELTGEDL